jgi:hypothetical protein
MKENHPLIIVFYLDAEMMQVAEIIKPFTESVNMLLSQKNANALAFFLPTKGEERVECINPTIISEPDMAKINKLVEDIKTNFSIGEDINLDIEDVEITEKPCECGNNPDGKCKCND